MLINIVLLKNIFCIKPRPIRTRGVVVMKEDPNADIINENLIYLKIQTKSVAEPEYKNLNWDWDLA